jgi:hypothetical protein
MSENENKSENESENENENENEHKNRTTFFSLHADAVAVAVAVTDISSTIVAARALEGTTFIAMRRRRRSVQAARGVCLLPTAFRPRGGNAPDGPTSSSQMQHRRRWPPGRDGGS